MVITPITLGAAAAGAWRGLRIVARQLKRDRKARQGRSASIRELALFPTSDRCFPLPRGQKTCANRAV